MRRKYFNTILIEEGITLKVSINLLSSKLKIFCDNKEVISFYTIIPYRKKIFYIKNKKIELKTFNFFFWRASLRSENFYCEEILPEKRNYALGRIVTSWLLNSLRFIF